MDVISCGSKGHDGIAMLGRYPSLTANLHMAFPGDEDAVRRFHADATAAGYRRHWGERPILLIVDDSIDRQPEIYLEGGDHETLIHMGQAQFAALTANAPHGRFSIHD